MFLIALAINVKVTLEDPFVMLSEQAIATGSSGGGNGGGGATGIGTGSSGNCYDCVSGSADVCQTTTWYYPDGTVSSVTKEYGVKKPRDCNG